MYDTKAPLQLKKLQQWFGRIIGRPIDEDSRMNPISPSGESMEIEAARYIVPSPTMRPAQRIQIYNQQYWWRLLNILHDTFPTVIRILGYYEFNKNIGIPYVLKHPPTHWSIIMLGDQLTNWIHDEYQGTDKALIEDATKIDWAFNYSFIVEQLPQLTKEQITHIEELTLVLQPSVALFKTEGDFFKFRNECLEYPPEHWQDNQLPKIEKDRIYYYVLYRNQYLNIAWTEITSEEFQLLTILQSGKTINQMCDWLEEQEQTLCDTAMTNLNKWFEEWTARNWLSFS